MDPINVKLDDVTMEDFTVNSALKGDGQFINQEIPQTAAWRRMSRLQGVSTAALSQAPFLPTGSDS